MFLKLHNIVFIYFVFINGNLIKNGYFRIIKQIGGIHVLVYTKYPFNGYEDDNKLIVFRDSNYN